MNYNIFQLMAINSMHPLRILCDDNLPPQPLLQRQNAHAYVTVPHYDHEQTHQSQS